MMFCGNCGISFMLKETVQDVVFELWNEVLAINYESIVLSMY